MGKSYGVMNSYLNTVISKLLENEEFCKFLYYQDSVDEDILEKPNLTMEQKIGLIGDKLILSKRDFTTQLRAEANVQIRINNLDYSSNKSSNTNKIRVYFYIIVHNDLIKTKNGARDLCLVTALHKTFDSSSIGIGNVRHWATKDLNGLGIFYQGYLVGYEIFDYVELVRDFDDYSRNVKPKRLDVNDRFN